MKPKTQTQQNKTGNVEAKQSHSNRENNTSSAENNREVKSLRKDAPTNVDALDKYESSPDLNSQRCPMVGVKKKEGGNTQNLHNQPRTFCESEQLDKDGSSLNSQLNPSGIDEEYNPDEIVVYAHRWDSNCDKKKYIKLVENLIYKTRRLATAKALYNEKKKTLYFLIRCSRSLTLIDYEENDRMGLTVLRDINNTKRTLESEIKQIENEVPEVKK